MIRKSWLTLLVIIVVITLTACSNDEQVSETTDQEPKDQPVVSVEEGEQGETELTVEKDEPTFKNQYPFTGEKTNDEVNKRAVAVMVNNHPKARPQTGLTKADVVFEILAEGNITRFLAIYQSEQPEVVGPIRSARPYYFNLAKGYNSIYLYHGAAGFINDMLRDSGTDFLDGARYDNDNHLFKRESFRVAPHNSYLLFDAVHEVASQNGYQIEAEHVAYPFLTEQEIDSIDGDQATEIDYSYGYNNVNYHYDETTEKYSRYNEGIQTVELETGEAVQLDNLFFIETYHHVFDDKGRREVDLQSGGDAYLFQKGTWQQVEWKNIDGQILAVKDGEEVGFVPGKTWVNVIPESSGLEQVSIQ